MKDKIRSTLLRQALLDKAKAMKMYVERDQDLDPLKQQLSESIQIGLLSHCLLLEQDKLDERYVFFNGNYGGKEHKRLLDQNLRQEPLKEKFLEKAQEMYNVVVDFMLANKELKELFYTGSKEVYLEHEDDDFIHTIKPDVLGYDYFIDYKTSSISFPEKYTWILNCNKYKMFIQLGYYYKVLELMGYNIKGAYHLVQTTSYPYHCNLFFFDRNDLIVMKEDADYAIEVYKKMLEYNNDKTITIDDISKITRSDYSSFSDTSLDECFGLPDFDD